MIGGLQDELTERRHRFRISFKKEVCEPQVAMSDRQCERIDAQVGLGNFEGPFGMARIGQDHRKSVISKILVELNGFLELATAASGIPLKHRTYPMWA